MSPPHYLSNGTSTRALAPSILKMAGNHVVQPVRHYLFGWNKWNKCFNRDDTISIIVYSFWQTQYQVLATRLSRHHAWLRIKLRLFLTSTLWDMRMIFRQWKAFASNMFSVYGRYPYVDQWCNIFRYFSSAFVLKKMCIVFTSSSIDRWKNSERNQHSILLPEPGLGCDEIASKVTGSRTLDPGHAGRSNRDAEVYRQN